MIWFCAAVFLGSIERSWEERKDGGFEIIFYERSEVFDLFLDGRQDDLVGDKDAPGSKQCFRPG